MNNANPKRARNARLRAAKSQKGMPAGGAKPREARVGEERSLA